MQLDAWFSMVVFTVATVAFYLLGAAVLHPAGARPQGAGDDPDPLADVPPAARRDAAGGPAALTRVGFLLGAWAVLFKTLYVATAANSRLTADFLDLTGIWQPARARRARADDPGLLRASTRSWRSASTYAFREPQGLIKVGGIAQALMLPLIAGATLYLRQPRHRPPRRPVVPDRHPHLARLLRDLGRGHLQHLRPRARRPSSGHAPTVASRLRPIDSPGFDVYNGRVVRDRAVDGTS